MTETDSNTSLENMTEPDWDLLIETVIQKNAKALEILAEL